MLIAPLFASLIRFNSVTQPICPDGVLSPLQCNQRTRVCEADPSLSCHPIEGVYFCCNIPTVVTFVDGQRFVSETQRQETAPDSRGDDADGEGPKTDDGKEDGGNPEEKCEDENPETCAQVKNQCGSKVLKEMMKTQCPKTCGFCCADKRKECPTWKKYGFCETDQITDTKRKELCQKSCGFCGQLRE
ncbi:hypothetical protein M3Y94_01104600 [Aphelenchoides besseyi]|nr:hypothetical protein M3Y94_01104600 [Aphelenchoides besseyi]KAI6221579.1 hypothetical protein M3Y95_00977000 [Aphelenchoides besseyi]